MKPPTSKGKISAVFELGKNGVLKAIYSNAESEHDQKILEKGLERIINPLHYARFRRLFRK